ncbi:MAG: LytR/AlgR family response regulator transcription factor [Bacteroidota bacterium]
MSDKLKVIIIDDEPLAIKGLINYIEEIKYIELVGTCENAMDANEILNNQLVDLMFLDIQMPKINGIAFLKTLKNKPLSIITSAFSEHAFEAYELDVIDYLLKPVTFERFLKACDKAKEYFDFMSRKKNQGEDFDFLFVRSGKKLEKIYFDEILFVEAIKNYISIYTVTKRFIVHLSLKSIEENLPSSKFIKVQKSFVISIPKITSINKNSILLNNFEIPISMNNTKEIVKASLNNKYLSYNKPI